MKKCLLLLMMLIAPIAAFADKYGVQEAIAEGPPPDSGMWWLAIAIPGAVLLYCWLSSRK